MEDRNRQSSAASSMPVIAVGVLLAVIVLLFAVQWLSRPRAIVDGATCSNNLHQLGLAFASYTSDYPDRLPDPDKWPQQTLVYCKTIGVHTCPQSSRRSGTKLKFEGWDREARITYSMNSRLKGLTVRDVKNPADTVLLFESSGAKLAGGPELLPTEIRHEQTSMQVIHRIVVHVLFVDGHVKRFPIDEVRNLKWDPK